MSQGLLAVAGSSLRVLSGGAAEKPPTPSAHVAASEPPATMISASPYSIRRAESPIQWLAVVQAVTIARQGPLNPYMIERFPEIMLMIAPGMKNGEILRGPPSIRALWVSSIRGSPP